MAGLFKQTDDIKALDANAPGPMQQTKQRSTSVQAPMGPSPAQAVEQTRHAAPGQRGRASGPDFAPIANVSLELFAEISKSLATVNYDLTQGPRMAAAHGITAENWAAALEGWNARMKSNPAVGRRFGALHAAS